MKKIAVALTITTLGISIAHATQKISTGRISFAGAIVEDSCRVNQQGEQMQLICLSGSEQTKEIINLHRIAKQSFATSQVSYQWLNKNHTLAMISISHK
ncbi:type 1 fimbrial protein [Aeromonas sp. V90_14]|uniref:type 1 fimbrial protein n=1 Tax=Aeromonas sp. V90_14 TaxID=3044241 RepID=UPI00249E53DF|nr:type 1 fimbrial protein [Aeromonas sp. V90_14]MDI3430276.1 type 1 fimbrial protein [Aeromonas sp. V90_14]